MHPLRPVLASLVLLPALLLTACGGEQGVPERAPPVSAPADTWDLSRLPDPGPVLEARTTTEGVRILVLAQGEGPESTDTTVMDVPYTGYLRTGQEFERSVMRFGGYYRPSRSNLMAGLRMGLAGIRHGERRRLLVPAAQAFGWETPTPAVPRGSDMVFDVRAFMYAQSDLEVGTGAEVKPGQTVRAHYVGMFPDGRVFEESRKVGDGVPTPLTLREGQVISGWVQGVPGMRVGGRRRLRIPASLAYGARGEPKARIPPNADLVFVIELLEILPDQPAPR